MSNRTRKAPLERLGKEATLVGLIEEFLEKQRYNTELEVPNMGQSTDIVARKGNRLTFIEAKRSDWRRGIKQCLAHELVADYVCLAISTVNISLDLSQTVKEKGYGLIHCDPYSKECTWAIKPKLNKKIWAPQRQALLNHLRRMINGN